LLYCQYVKERISYWFPDAGCWLKTRN